MSTDQIRSKHVNLAPNAVHINTERLIKLHKEACCNLPLPEFLAAAFIAWAANLLQILSIEVTVPKYMRRQKNFDLLHSGSGIDQVTELGPAEIFAFQVLQVRQHYNHLETIWYVYQDGVELGEVEQLEDHFEVREALLDAEVEVRHMMEVAEYHLRVEANEHPFSPPQGKTLAANLTLCARQRFCYQDLALRL